MRSTSLLDRSARESESFRAFIPGIAESISVVSHNKGAHADINIRPDAGTGLSIGSDHGRFYHASAIVDHHLPVFIGKGDLNSHLPNSNFSAST